MKNELLVLTNYTFPLFSYLLGSIPFGLLFSKIKGKDPRKYGSGNIGATNIARVIGKKWGIFTLICDLLKGLIPVFLAKIAGVSDFFIALTGLFAVCGHCFSIFLGFKGGKGVATALGVFLGICPLAVAFGAFIFGIALYYSKFVSVGSLSAATSMPIFIYLFCNNSFYEAMAWTICFIIWIRHKDNLIRLAKGEEKGINFRSQET